MAGRMAVVLHALENAKERHMFRFDGVLKSSRLITCTLILIRICSHQWLMRRVVKSQTGLR